MAASHAVLVFFASVASSAFTAFTCSSASSAFLFCPDSVPFGSTACVTGTVFPSSFGLTISTLPSLAVSVTLASSASS